MVWPAIIAGAAAIGSGLLSNSSAKSREKAADYREYELSKKLWEYQMSNSHQFQVEDLRKAGINPMLSASAQSNTTGNVGGHISSGGNFENVMTNAVQAFQAQQQAKVQNSQVGVNEATAENQTSSAKEHAANAEYQQMKNAYLRDNPSAQAAEFGNENISHPQQMYRGIATDIKNKFGKNAKANEERIRKDVDNAKKYVTGKVEQTKKWLKDNSPINAAKSLYESYKNYSKRVDEWRYKHHMRYVRNK